MGKIFFDFNAYRIRMLCISNYESFQIHGEQAHTRSAPLAHSDQGFAWLVRSNSRTPMPVTAQQPPQSDLRTAETFAPRLHVAMGFRTRTLPPFRPTVPSSGEDASIVHGCIKNQIVTNVLARL